jgi:hypothetical protein
VIVKTRTTENGCEIPTDHSLKKRPMVTLPMARYLYEVENGRLPQNIVVRHTCDNRYCVNLDHLVPGTNLDNVRDMVERNRQARGSRSSHSKLDEDQVREIRRSELSKRKIAKVYGVSANAIKMIRQGRSWGWLQ